MPADDRDAVAVVRAQHRVVRPERHLLGVVTIAGQQIGHVRQRRLMRVVRDQRTLARPRCGRSVLANRQRRAVDVVECRRPARGRRTRPWAADRATHSARCRCRSCARLRLPARGSAMSRTGRRSRARTGAASDPDGPDNAPSSPDTARAPAGRRAPACWPCSAPGCRMSYAGPSVCSPRCSTSGQVRRQRPRGLNGVEIRRDAATRSTRSVEHLAPTRQVIVLDGGLREDQPAPFSMTPRRR